MTGELRHAYDGWSIPPEWSIECSCMEGPKLMERGGSLRLGLAAVGEGTVVFDDFRYAPLKTAP